MRMFHAKTYRKAFWTGFFHAMMILLYSIFISLIWMSIIPYVEQSGIPALTIGLGMFILLLSAAVIAYIIFFAPMKLIVHHQFKAATVLIVSTFGWLFVCLCIGLMSILTII